MTTTATTAAATTEGPGRRPHPWQRIRVRIVVGYVALLIAALAISVTVTRQVLLNRLDGDIEAALVQEVEELRALSGGTNPATGAPFGPDTRALFDTFLRRNVPADHETLYAIVAGRPFLVSHDALAPEDAPALFDAWAAISEVTWGSAATPIGELRYLAVPVGRATTEPGVFVAAYAPADERAEIERVARVVAATSAVALVVSAGLAWSLAGRVLHPVRALTRAARRVSETDLSHRIPVEGRDELAELGATFNAMLDRLEQGFAGQRRFLDDVAHELRTPITIASGHLELLGDDPDERAETVAVINDELARMNRYVDDLLLLAKAEQQEFLRLAPVDVGEFAEVAHQRVTAIADRRWLLDAAPRPGSVAVIADEQRLMQALVNLASNAAEHTGPGDEIGLGFERVTRSDGDWVRMWVRDSGPGIDEAQAEQLFQRRYRGASSRVTRREGMGIGLSIVDAIARGHGGTATAGNEPSGGARFVVTIPIEPTPPAGEEPPA